MSRDNLLKFGL